VSVRLVLDTSALAAYLAADTRAIEIGELIATVEEGGDLTGVPALCLIEAWTAADAEQRARLAELTDAEAGPTVVLPVLATAVAPIASRIDAGLPADLAHAAAAAAEHGALLGTYRRADYRDAVDPDEILDL
jgi:hypothetical protein